MAGGASSPRTTLALISKVLAAEDEDVNGEIKVFAGYVILVLVAALLFFLHVVYRDETWSSVFLALASAVAAVVLVEAVWDLSGGARTSRAVTRVWAAVTALRTSTSLLRDLEGTGIERIHRERRNADFESWLALMGSATEVDMMGHSLRRDWTARDEFTGTVKRRAEEQKGKFRILALDPRPDSPNYSIIERRMQEEEDVEKRMIADGSDTLRKLTDIREGLSTEAKAYLQIKVVQMSTQYCYYVRVDDRILVANYLCHIRGSGLPAMEIGGRHTAFFRVFADEFDRMWALGAEWPPPTPVEDSNT